jgi:hypothetical protein
MLIRVWQQQEVRVIAIASFGDLATAWKCLGMVSKWPTLRNVGIRYSFYCDLCCMDGFQKLRPLHSMLASV